MQLNLSDGNKEEFTWRLFIYPLQVILSKFQFESNFKCDHLIQIILEKFSYFLVVVSFLWELSQEDQVSACLLIANIVIRLKKVMVLSYSVLKTTKYFSVLDTNRPWFVQLH